MNRSVSVLGIALLCSVTAIAQEKSTRRPGGANASFTVHEFHGSNGHALRYSLFVPAAKGSERPAAKLPLILCLHGAGGNTAAANVLAATEMQEKHPCVVMAPTCEGRDTRWIEAPFGRGESVSRRLASSLLAALSRLVALTTTG